MNTPMKSVEPGADHMAFRKALEGVIAQHGATLDAVELLALVAHLVGQLVALQDQRTMTADMAMEIVVRNIEQGNADAINPLMFGSYGGSA